MQTSTATACDDFTPEFLASLTPELLAVEIARTEAALTRKRWADFPEQWAAERLGYTLWSGQVRILHSLRDNRRTNAQTCHEIGKSLGAAVATGWWLDIHEVHTAFVITTAPTQPQVRLILWKEIGRVHEKGGLDGRVTTLEWKMRVGNKEETVAIGRKTSDYSPTSFHGNHAEFMLVIIDEANGVRGPLWESADSLIANDTGKILALGNPDDPSGEFYENCKPGSGWHTISISAFDSPNFTGEPMPADVLRQLIGKVYVEEKRKKWASDWVWVKSDCCALTTCKRCYGRGYTETCVPPEGKSITDSNPLWQSKVMGVFPDRADKGGLIPISWIYAAQMREIIASVPVELGVDVGGGGDLSAVGVRRGFQFRIRRTDSDPNTMSQCGKVIDDMRATGATSVKIDKIGIGWGITERGIELGHPFVGINVGVAATKEDDDTDEPASDDRFLNKKAELWWGVRGLFERGLIDIEATGVYAEDLAAELANVRYERLSNGKIKIADKRKDANGKTVASPNLAECLLLAFAPEPVGEKTIESGYVW